MSNEQSLAESVEVAIGVSAESISPLSGGSVGEVYRADTHEHGAVVIKVDRSADARLNLEGDMLEYLIAHAKLPVPIVLYSSPGLLIMQMLPGSSTFSASAEQHAADLLAELHTIQSPAFGFHYDTLIGSLHQPNTVTLNWIPFFRDHRLLHMAQHAYQESRMGLDTLNRIEKFASNLEQWIDEPEHPALLHGDVWTTNVLADSNTITGFVDPAIYYGHSETELAFITLFNTFGSAFFDRYNEHRPIHPDFFTTRKDIYTLYPLLVHVRLFGGSYLRSVESTIARFGY